MPTTTISPLRAELLELDFSTLAGLGSRVLGVNHFDSSCDEQARLALIDRLEDSLDENRPAHQPVAYEGTNSNHVWYSACNPDLPRIGLNGVCPDCGGLACPLCGKEDCGGGASCG